MESHSRGFTTAETLVLETVVLGTMLGLDHWVFSNRCWVQPQLEALSHHGLVTWRFDENADFKVTPTERLRNGPEFQSLAQRQGLAMSEKGNHATTRARATL